MYSNVVDNRKRRGKLMENLTAYVAQPNTPETDGMLDVNHIVSWTENSIQKSMTVLARDPMEAIRLIQRLYRAK